MKKIHSILGVIAIMLVVGVGCTKKEVTKVTEDNVPNLESTTQETPKVFEGNGFSFNYPEKYLADDNGLWTKEGYEWHLNPPDDCNFCHVPYLEVKAEATNKTLEKYIIDDFTLTGESLEEMSKDTGIPYEVIKINNNEFVKITVSDMLSVTGYYTKHINTVVSFKVSSSGYDSAELQEMLATLKFE
ncbi:MAG: hypothetical protein ABIJ23_01395 [Candidatus Magasanikbacteria bacterium]